jgi:hypothetical protein
MGTAIFFPMFLSKLDVTKIWLQKKFNAVYGEVCIINNGAELISMFSCNALKVAVLSHSGRPRV